MIWPIVLIVISNIFYNICSKETPSSINPFASLTVTYAVGAVVSLIMFFLFDRGGNLFSQYKNLSWSSFVLGAAVVGLEAGSVYMYKAGWSLGSGQLVYSILLAVCLVLIGILFYHEALTVTKSAGILVCMLGLYLITK